MKLPLFTAKKKTLVLLNGKDLVNSGRLTRLIALVRNEYPEHMPAVIRITVTLQHIELHDTDAIELYTDAVLTAIDEGLSFVTITKRFLRFLFETKYPSLEPSGEPLRDVEGGELVYITEYKDQFNIDDYIDDLLDENESKAIKKKLTPKAPEPTPETTPKETQNKPEPIFYRDLGKVVKSKYKVLVSVRGGDYIDTIKLHAKFYRGDLLMATQFINELTELGFLYDKPLKTGEYVTPELVRVNDLFMELTKIC